MAYHVVELPLYPAAELESQLGALPPAWTLKFVMEAVPIQLRQSKSLTRDFTGPGGKPMTTISPTAIFIFTS